jgi:hypothetical protein
VPADDGRKPGGRRVQIERLPIVQHVKRTIVKGNHLYRWQPGAEAVLVDVAAYGGDWGQGPQGIQNSWVANVAGMQYVVDTAQGGEGFWPHEAVRIGDDPDQRLLAHKPMSKRVRGSR